MKKAFLTVSVVLLIGGLSAYRYYDRGYAREAQAAPTAGERLYVESCAACHGQKGDGKGPEANRLKTKPRDFTGGIYKFRSTPPVLFLWTKTFFERFPEESGLRACSPSFTFRKRRDGL